MRALLTSLLVAVSCLVISAQDQSAHIQTDLAESDAVPASGSGPNLVTDAPSGAGIGAALPPVANFIAPVKPAVIKTEPRFQWHSAVKQSLFFLSIQHSFRMVTEPGTRAELKGPFF